MSETQSPEEVELARLKKEEADLFAEMESIPITDAYDMAFGSEYFCARACFFQAARRVVAFERQIAANRSVSNV